MPSTPCRWPSSPWSGRLRGRPRRSRPGSGDPAAQPRPKARDHAAADDVRLDQHGSQQEQAKEDGYRADRQQGDGVDLHLDTVDDHRGVIGTPSRSTLSISTITKRAKAAADHPAAPPRIEAPPMITDAITISSALRPAWEVAPLSWAIAIRPAIVAHSDDRGR